MSREEIYDKISKLTGTVIGRVQKHIENREPIDQDLLGLLSRLLDMFR